MTTEIKLDEYHRPLRYFNWVDRDVTPHWMRPGNKGHASLRVRTHIGNKYLDLHTTEFGNKSAKTTMITLSAEDGRKFYDWLKTVYEPDPKRTAEELAELNALSTQ